MSKYSVDITEPAQQDMRDIARYISAELGAPTSAQGIIDILADSMYNLENNTKRHALVRDDRLAAKGYRVLPIKNYHIFYKVEEETRIVDVVRILYSRRDWVSLL